MPGGLKQRAGRQNNDLKEVAVLRTLRDAQVGETVTVACRKDFDLRLCRKMFPEHCRFVVGVFVAENGDALALCGKCFCKPGAEGRLSRAPGAV